MVEIPLVGGAGNTHQTFSAILGGVELSFKLDYLAYLESPAWNMTLGKGNEVLVEGLLLKCGCDMLAPYQFGLGALVLAGNDPTMNNLGVENTLYWLSEDEKVQLKD
jgi:hypothetical protein